MPRILMLIWFAFPAFAVISRGGNYPNATLDQATSQTLDALRIDRYEALDEGSLQAEYRWALDMARLCVADRHSIEGRREWWDYAIEFQRHAGRTSRYCGFAERAIDDYMMGIEYAYAMIPVLRDAVILEKGRTPELFAAGWEECILRDIADTYLITGGYQIAADLSNVIMARMRTRGEAFSRSGADVDRLALIAQQEGRFAQSVNLLQRMYQAQQDQVAAYLDRHPELRRVDRNQSWGVVVRDSDVRQLMEDPGYDDQGFTNNLRLVYCRLGRALRLNGQRDEAVYALDTAELTPWRMDGRWRDDLDLDVDREWSFLALDRGEAGEAVRRGNDCLSKYTASIHPSERVELLDLVSRGLEGQGKLHEAFDRLGEAIDIVENRRANLVLDEYKQLYIGQYAGLYRRACELVIRMGRRDGRRGDLGKTNLFDRRTVERSFVWSERAKGRAMLDSMRRLGRRMEEARDAGDVEAIKRTRRDAAAVVSIDRLQQTEWLNDGLALVAYMVSPRGAWAWVVRKNAADLVALDVETETIERQAAALKNALRPEGVHDDSWIAPAEWLYDALIRPLEAKLGGASQLVIVGDGVLRTVPFEVFIDRVKNPTDSNPWGWGGSLLIERFTVSYAPSATVLAHATGDRDDRHWDYDYWGFASTKFHGDAGVRNRRAALNSAKRGGSVRDDSVAMVLRSARSLDNLAPLPHAGREVEQVAKRFPKDRRRTYIDYHENNKTAKGVLLAADRSGELKGVRHLHFATHAILDSDRPFDSGLVLSPPYVDALEKTPAQKGKVDGLRRVAPLARWDRRARRASILTLREIAGLNLGCELVVASSCQALGGAPVDGDWLNGLTRSFLVAGSEAVICTLWDVADDAALQITTATYRAIRHPQPSSSGSPADALRDAKLSLRRSPMYRHPAHWSGFVCYGGVRASAR